MALDVKRNSEQQENTNKDMVDGEDDQTSLGVCLATFLLLLPFVYFHFLSQLLTKIQIT